MADRRILLTVMPSIESIDDLRKFLSRANERYSFQAFMRRLKNYDSFAGNYLVGEDCSAKRLTEMSGKRFCKKYLHNTQFWKMDGRLVLPQTWKEFIDLTSLEPYQEAMAYLDVNLSGESEHTRAKIHWLEQALRGAEYRLSGIEFKKEPEKLSLRESA